MISPRHASSSPWLVTRHSANHSAVWCHPTSHRCCAVIQRVVLGMDPRTWRRSATVWQLCPWMRTPDKIWQVNENLWIAVGYCVADRLSWVILWSLQNSGAHSKDGKSRDEGWICFGIWESSGWHHSAAQLKLQLNTKETELFWTVLNSVPNPICWALLGGSEIQWDWGCLMRTCMRNGMHKMTCFSLRRRSDCANNKLPKTIILQLWIRMEYTVDEYRWILTWLFFCPFM